MEVFDIFLKRQPVGTIYIHMLQIMVNAKVLPTGIIIYTNARVTAIKRLNPKAESLIIKSNINTTKIDKRLFNISNGILIQSSSKVTAIKNLTKLSDGIIIKSTANTVLTRYMYDLEDGILIKSNDVNTKKEIHLIGYMYTLDDHDGKNLGDMDEEELKKLYYKYEVCPEILVGASVVPTFTEVKNLNAISNSIILKESSTITTSLTRYMYDIDDGIIITSNDVNTKKEIHLIGYEFTLEDHDGKTLGEMGEDQLKKLYYKYEVCPGIEVGSSVVPTFTEVKNLNSISNGILLEESKSISTFLSRYMYDVDDGIEITSNDVNTKKEIHLIGYKYLLSDHDDKNLGDMDDEHLKELYYNYEVSPEVEISSDVTFSGDKVLEPLSDSIIFGEDKTLSIWLSFFMHGVEDSILFETNDIETKKDIHLIGYEYTLDDYGNNKLSDIDEETLKALYYKYEVCPAIEIGSEVQEIATKSIAVSGDTTIDSDAVVTEIKDEQVISSVVIGTDMLLHMSRVRALSEFDELSLEDMENLLLDECYYVDV